MKYPLIIILVLLNMFTCLGYDPQEYDGNGFNMTYMYEHVKGDTYTIVFLKGEIGTIEWIYTPNVFLFGDQISNSTHIWYDYNIFVGAEGGAYTLELEVYDLNTQLLEHIFLDLHVLLDKNDEERLNTIIEAKDKRIEELEEETEQQQQELGEIKEPPEEFTDKFKRLSRINEPFVPLIYFTIACFSFMPWAVYRAVHTEKATQSMDMVLEAVKGKNYEELTWSDVQKIIVHVREGRFVNEPQIINLLDDQLVAIMNAFDPVVHHWLTFIPEKEKKDLNIHTKDLTVEERMKRLIEAYPSPEISENYDIWSQIIKFKIIPTCFIFKQHWGRYVEDFEKIAINYDKKATEVEEKRIEDTHKAMTKKNMKGEEIAELEEDSEEII